MPSNKKTTDNKSVASTDKQDKIIAPAAKTLTPSTSKAVKTTKSAPKTQEKAIKSVPKVQVEEIKSVPKVQEKAVKSVPAVKQKTVKSVPVVKDKSAKSVPAVKKKSVNAVALNDTIISQASPTVKIEGRKKILFVASECSPYIATGGLAEVIGSLSKALACNKDFDVRVVVPLYEGIGSAVRANLTYLGNYNVALSWRNQYCGVFTMQKDGVIFYFIDNEYYFKRPNCYGYYDDGERFAYFSKASLELMSFLQFYPDIMHCHDWQAASAVIYLKTIYSNSAKYNKIRSMFTIHNIEYQGKYSLDILGDLFGLPDKYKSIVEYKDCINLTKGAIEVSDTFSTVSPRYAEEIKSAYFAHGLDAIIRRNSFKLFGILNGIDVDSYNAETDAKIAANFGADDFGGKAVCKRALQEHVRLPVNANVPVIALVSRLVSHKGLDLVKAVLVDMLANNDVQFVILGKGDYAYEVFFNELAKKYPNKLATLIAFNNTLSRMIYAGADMFLMPSKSEPCGLSQMIASRYATVPIVRETGGLFDSIKPYGAGGNGFTFANYNAHDMCYVINEALKVYSHKDEWLALMKKVINTDFSWRISAKEYENKYNQLLS